MPKIRSARVKWKVHCSRKRKRWKNCVKQVETWRRSFSPVRVKARLGGERIRAGLGRHHKDVKDILREAGIPPWLRPAVPLLYTQETMLAVGDLVISAQLDKWLKKNHAHLCWQPSDPLLQFVHKQCQNEAVDHADSLG